LLALALVRLLALALEFSLALASGVLTWGPLMTAFCLDHGHLVWPARSGPRGAETGGPDGRGGVMVALALAPAWACGAATWGPMMPACCLDHGHLVWRARSRPRGAGTGGHHRPAGVMLALALALALASGALTWGPLMTAFCLDRGHLVRPARSGPSGAETG